jgi:hypothetical protein
MSTTEERDAFARVMARTISEQQVEDEIFLDAADHIHDIELASGYNGDIVAAQRMYVLAHFLAAERISDEKRYLRRMQMQSQLDEACGGAVEVVGAGRRMTEDEQYRVASLLCSEYMLRRHSVRAQEFEKRKADIKMLAQWQAEGPSVASSSEEGAPAAEHSATDSVPVRPGLEIPPLLPELPKDQQAPPRRPCTRRPPVSAAVLQEKAAELDGELKDLSNAYYDKFAEWQATVVKARRQKKAEKRAAYEERNRRDRLRQAGHVVPPEPLNPAQLAAERTSEHDDEPVPVKEEVKEEVPKRVPPGGQIASKEKRVKR